MAPKTFNFPAKRTTALFLLTATTAAAAAQTTNSAVLSPLAALSADKTGGEIHGLVRTARAVSTVPFFPWLHLSLLDSSQCLTSLLSVSSILDLSGCFHCCWLRILFARPSKRLRPVPSNDFSGFRHLYNE